MKIQLTKGFEAIVDAEDFRALDAHNWYVLDGHPVHRYAARWIPGTRPRRLLRMHHAVLQIDPIDLKKYNLVVDHIDRNGLNNTKANLRVVDRSTNAINSERSDKALGIYFDSYRGKYKAVYLPGNHFIGWFDTLEEAALIKAELCA